MKICFGIIFLMFSTVLADLTGKCELAAFYQEIGCTPVPSTKSNNGTDCPLAYNCPGYPDTTKCYYKGVAISDGDRIPQSLVDHPCSRQCVCHVTSYGSAFQCLVIDCMDTFAWFDANKNCISTRHFDSCCPGRICDADAIAKLKTCEYEGRTYKEGQSFYPTNTNKMCVCTAQWNGSIDSQDCKAVNCGLEIYHQSNIRRNCAPIFFSTQHICPIYLTCPSSDTTVIRKVKQHSQYGDHQCVFGDQTLSVGDEVKVNDHCTTCKCSVPPLVSCIRTLNC